MGSFPDEAKKYSCLSSMFENSMVIVALESEEYNPSQCKYYMAHGGISSMIFMYGYLCGKKIWNIIIRKDTDLNLLSSTWTLMLASLAIDGLHV